MWLGGFLSEPLQIIILPLSQTTTSTATSINCIKIQWHFNLLRISSKVTRSHNRCRLIHICHICLIVVRLTFESILLGSVAIVLRIMAIGSLILSIDHSGCLIATSHPWLPDQVSKIVRYRHGDT